MHGLHEKLLLVLTCTKPFTLRTHSKFTVELPRDTLVAFDSELEILYYGTEYFPFCSSEFIDLTRDMQFSSIRTITKEQYEKEYLQILGVDAERAVEIEDYHDYGDMSGQEGTIGRQLLDLGIKFKFKRH